MREQPRESAGSAERLRGTAPPRAWRSRRRRAAASVGDVADQRVLERELDVALDLALRASRRSARAPRARRAPRRAFQLADPVQHAAPERLPDHRRVQQRGPRGGRKRVDPRGDRGAHGRRQLLAGDLVRHRGDQFLEEQRVALGDRDDALDRVGLPSPEAAPPRPPSSLGCRAARAAASSAPPSRRPTSRRVSRNSGRASARTTTRASLTWVTRGSR